MGKSPGKWIKTVLFGKKPSKSSLSKDSSAEKKTSVTINSHSNDLGVDSMTISSPVRHVINVNEENTQLEKVPSNNLSDSTAENLRNTIGFNAENDDELIRLEQSATKAQAAFRGYLARRAFRALKGIIRLQAVARSHLVRRQAVATLSCVRAIVELQALVRGQRVRLMRNCPQNFQKMTPRDPTLTERANLLQTSLKSEKLSKSAFATKLVTSTKTTEPVNINYDPDEPNSVENWLDRWSSFHFWDPLPQTEKTLDIKPKRKQTKSQSQVTETLRPKRSIRKAPAPGLVSNNNFHENENTKQTEKVKHGPRKVSVSAAGGSEKSTVEIVNDVAEPALAPPVEPPPPPVETKTDGKVEGRESNGKENQKTRRRKSFPSKQEHPETDSQNAPAVPSYMAATESAKAKLRAQAAAEDGAENGPIRRHSLPSLTGKLSLQSPRLQKPLHANGKGVSKTIKPQIPPKDEKVVSGGWRR